MSDAFGDKVAVQRDDVLPPQYSACFGCGTDNDAGLALNFRRYDDIVRATVRFRDVHQGFPNIVQGGAITAALDEAMAYACVLIGGSWAATATMELRFRQSVPFGQDLVVEGGLTRPGSSKRFHTWARLLLADGAPAVEATALFVAIPSADIDGMFSPFVPEEYTPPSS